MESQKQIYKELKKRKTTIKININMASNISPPFTDIDLRDSIDVVTPTATPTATPPVTPNVTPPVTPTASHPITPYISFSMPSRVLRPLKKMKL